MLDLRPEVAAFAQAMEQRLRENEHKGGWEFCRVADLLRRCREELAELEDAYADVPVGGSPDTILHEAADVANFAMMIADVCGALVDRG